MGKKDEYRFNLRFDETDEMHRLVVKYLNSCGHNKAKYIVRAFLAYWKMSGKSLLSYVFPEMRSMSWEKISTVCLNSWKRRFQS